MFVLAMLLFISSAWSITDCVEQGNLHSPVVELERNGKKIILVGLNHFGPAEYYAKIKNLLQGGKNKDRRILTEFFTCTDSVLALKEGAQIDPDLLKKLAQDDWNRISLPKNDRRFEKQPCEPDPGGQMRPKDVADEYRRICANVKDKKIKCQWTELTDLKNARSGDLVMHQEAEATQLVSSIVFSEDLDRQEKKLSLESLQHRKDLKQKFVYEFREMKATKLALRELERFSEVVLPWGSGHISGFISKLEREGFRVTQVSRVPFINKNFRSGWKSFDDFYQRKLLEAPTCASMTSTQGVSPNQSSPEANR